MVLRTTLAKKHCKIAWILSYYQCVCLFFVYFSVCPYLASFPGVYLCLCWFIYLSVTRSKAILLFDKQNEVTYPYAELWILIMGYNFAFWKKSDASFIISDESDFFQNAKFCPILDIYNLPDDKCFQICMNKKLSFNFLAVVCA